jgi:FKBP-type peptidyl-prolyl cis-trans isomerase FkpA
MRRTSSWVSAAVLLSACGGGPPPGPLPPTDPEMVMYAEELNIDFSEFEKTRTGLFIQDLFEGQGGRANQTSLVWIYYIGWLPDGTIFDGTIQGDPFQFRLGGNEVIRGWNEGISGMRVGGRRKLVIRPGLAYGSRGRGDVPPGATLVFEVQLVDVN